MEKILTDLAKDDDSSLEALFDYYYPRLYNFSKSFLKIEDRIDDVLQEVFVKIWQNRKKINSADSFNSFVFTITRNLLLNELRAYISNEKMKDEIRKKSTAQEYSSIAQIEYADLKEKVDTIIETLPERQKQIFILSRIEGLSHKEIAEKLNIKTKTVEYHIAKSISYLKGRLKELGVLSVLYFYLFF
ncbi:MAG: RNA polymerase sigma factor [Draconibacterium sp.]